MFMPDIVLDRMGQYGDRQNATCLLNHYDFYHGNDFLPQGFSVGNFIQFDVRIPDGHRKLNDK